MRQNILSNCSLIPSLHAPYWQACKHARIKCCTLISVLAIQNGDFMLASYRKINCKLSVLHAWKLASVQSTKNCSLPACKLSRHSLQAISAARLLACKHAINGNCLLQACKLSRNSLPARCWTLVSLQACSQQKLFAASLQDIKKFTACYQCWKLEN